MTISANFPVSPSQGGAYQSSISYQSQSQQSMLYSNSNGETVKVEQSSSSSMSYQLSMSSGGSSESLVYSRQFSQTTQISNVKAVEEPPLLDGASNILGFIEQRLAKEAAAGATEEELGQLLEQGLAGFEQGFGEAMDILNADNSLNANVESSVGTLYSQVVNGLEDLKQQYTPSTVADAPEATATAVNTEAVVKEAPVKEAAIQEAPVNQEPVSVPKTVSAESEAPQPTAVASSAPQAVSAVQSIESSQTRMLRFSSIGGVEQMESLNSSSISSQRPIEQVATTTQLPGAEVAAETPEQITEVSETTTTTVAPNTGDQTRMEYGLKERFSFTLQTQDGDKVTIDALNTTVYAARLDDQGDNNSQLIEGLNNSENYSFNVEGDLDDEEIKAINDLMTQVMDLADTFYNNNVDAAYEQALAVGYDQNEIAAYSFSMKQVEQYSVASSYQALAPETTERPSLNGVFDLIGDYTSQLVEQLNTPNNFPNIDFMSLLTTAAEQIDDQVKHSEGAGFQQSIDPFVEA